MKIEEALLKSRAEFKKIKSESLKTYKQDTESIAFWLVVDPDTNDLEKIQHLTRILGATDWELENE